MPENRNKMTNTKKALIAMSGGVDSSVAAALMVEAGYECIGVTMKLFDNEDVSIPREHSCCSLEDVEDARSVAAKLGMPYYVFNFREGFQEQVIDRFVSAYETGSTPNPCIDCNRYMKFEKLYHRAVELDCDHVVTGHYARIAYDEKSGRWLLKKGINEAKDQSYVLCFMTQEQLAHTLFPLGEYADKEAVRLVAGRYGFVNAGKKDSQDICFVQTGHYADFIRSYTGKEYPPGPFIGPEGQVLGTHKGIICYTIGQRKGLGLALPEPLYVREKDVASNEVRLSREEALFSDRLIAEDVNWISIAPPEAGEQIRVSAKPRYRAKETPATAAVLEDGRVEVVFDRPVRAITRGQTVALYDGDLVVAGGRIM